MARFVPAGWPHFDNEGDVKIHRKEAFDRCDTAAKMADAVSWLSQVAADAGFHTVVHDLLAALDKLEAIATDEDCPMANDKH
jgi:hypothetical protein